MKYRKQGRYVYGRKPGADGVTITTWSSKPPPKGSTVYTLGWHDAQHPLMATGKYKQP